MINQQYLIHAIQDNGVVQLSRQHQPFPRSTWMHGWFDNADDLIHEANRLSTHGNLFISLNRPHSCDFTNKVDSYTGFKNISIERITRLLFDFDPVRAGYVSSTDGELSLATDCMNQALDYFRALGWPRPAVGWSGNGRHLLFRCALPNNTDTCEKLTAIYTGLKAELSTDDVSFDVTVRNAGRIAALYGSVKRKGEPTPERPHRQSSILLPHTWEQVTQEQVDSLANHYAMKQKALPERANRKREYAQSGRGDYSTLDVVSWFQSHGLYLKQTSQSHKHWVVCPWRRLHSGTGAKDTVIYLDSRIPTFSCSHDHCHDKNIFDVIAELGDADQYCSRDFGEVAQ